MTHDGQRMSSLPDPPPGQHPQRIVRVDLARDQRLPARRGRISCTSGEAVPSGARSAVRPAAAVAVEAVGLGGPQAAARTMLRVAHWMFKQAPRTRGGADVACRGAAGFPSRAGGAIAARGDRS